MYHVFENYCSGDIWGDVFRNFSSFLQKKNHNDCIGVNSELYTVFFIEG